MSSLFLSRGKRLLYLSGSACASASVFSSKSSMSSSAMFTNYLDTPYTPFEERFEQKSNSNTVKILSEFECRRLFSMSDAIRIQGEAFTAMYKNETIVPPRIILSIPDGQSAADDTLFKPSLNGNILGQKVVSVRPNNPALYSLPSITGCIILWDRNDGSTKCLMDAQFITARRTAAGSGFATDLFAPSDMQILTIFGAGNQALEHVRTVLTVRKLPKVIYIVNRTLSKAEKLKQTLLAEINDADKVEIVALSLSEFQRGQYDKYRQVVGDADVICTCTNSEEPLFDGKLLKKGVHINAVGSYKSNMIELDENVVQQCYVFVDSVHAFHSGDLYDVFNVEQDDENLSGVHKLNQTKWREIGEYMNNDIGKQKLDGKETGKPIEDKFEQKMTLFKSVGVAAQDLHSAYFIYDSAVRNDIGTDVPL